MAKQSSPKKRREHRPNIPAASRPEAVQAVIAKAAAAAQKNAPASTASAAGGAKVNFAQEYSYVIKDLRSMVIIALLMLILLIVLNFLIV